MKICFRLFFYPFGAPLLAHPCIRLTVSPGLNALPSISISPLCLCPLCVGRHVDDESETLIHYVTQIVFVRGKPQVRNGQPLPLPAETPTLVRGFDKPSGLHSFAAFCTSQDPSGLAPNTAPASE